MIDENHNDYDPCYECTAYGDDYRYDEKTGELIRNCDDCLFNSLDWEDD